MKKYTHIILASCLAATNLATSTSALAVGGGLPFAVEEGSIPMANMHNLVADSLDFTYHACADVSGPVFGWKHLVETGYFWISSYQDTVGVVDSQINHYLANGYRIYGRYTFEAVQVPPAPQQTPTGDRLNYLVNNASIQLYVDPMQNTVLGISNCQNTIMGNDDDTLLGESLSIIQGELSETNGLANGDFKIVFDNWMWDLSAAGFMIPSVGLTLLDYKVLVFNGNITDLRGPVRLDHKPEGSGNLFWLNDFEPVVPANSAD